MGSNPLFEGCSERHSGCLCYRVVAWPLRAPPCEQVMSANDIAIFGGLCGLASFDRNELKTKVRGAVPRGAACGAVERLRVRNRGSGAGGAGGTGKE